MKFWRKFTCFCTHRAIPGRERTSGHLTLGKLKTPIRSTLTCRSNVTRTSISVSQFQNVYAWFGWYAVNLTAQNHVICTNSAAHTDFECDKNTCGVRTSRVYIATPSWLLLFPPVHNMTYYVMSISSFAMSDFRRIFLSRMHQSSFHAANSLRKDFVLTLSIKIPLDFSKSTIMMSILLSGVSIWVTLLWFPCILGITPSERLM